MSAKKAVYIANENRVDYIDLTPDEIAAMKAEQEHQPIPEPTQEERLSAIESAMLALLGGGSDV